MVHLRAGIVAAERGAGHQGPCHIRLRRVEREARIIPVTVGNGDGHGLEELRAVRQKREHLLARQPGRLGVARLHLLHIDLYGLRERALGDGDRRVTRDDDRARLADDGGVFMLL